MARKQRRNLDLRNFWPWYERYLPIAKYPAEPPPFDLSDLSDDPPLPGRKWLQLYCLVGAVLVLAFLVWGIFH